MKIKIKKNILFTYRLILNIFINLLANFYSYEKLLLKIYYVGRNFNFSSNYLNKCNISSLNLNNHLFEISDISKNLLNKNLNIKNFHNKFFYYYPEFDAYSISKINKKKYYNYFYSVISEKKVNSKHKFQEQHYLNLDFKKLDILKSTLIGFENFVQDIIQLYKPILVNITLQTYDIVSDSIPSFDFINFMKNNNYILIGMNNEQNINTLNPFANYTFLIDERNNNQLDSKQLDKIKKILLFYDYEKLSSLYESQINAKK